MLEQTTLAPTPESSALLTLKPENGKTLLLPKGVHHLFPGDFPFRHLHISNNDDGIKHIVFDLSGMENVTIDGNGAELILHGHLIPFYMRDAKNITLKNLTIDWEHPFCAQGEVVDAGPGWVEIKLEEAYDLRVCDGRLQAHTPDWMYPVGIHNLNYIDPVRGEHAYQSTDEYGMFTHEDYTAIQKEARVLRLESDVMRNKPQVGQVAVFHFDGRTSPVVSAQNCEGIRIENSTIFHAGAIATIFEGCRDVYLDHLEVRRRGKRWFSSLNDATHFVECKGNIFLTNCLFEFQNDDATNIHGIYRSVDAALNEDTLLLRLMHFQQLGVDTIGPGDSLALCDCNSLKTLAIRRVSKVLPQDHQCTAYQFSEKLPDLDWNHVVVMRYESDVHVLIQGNTIRNNRARGILITSMGKVEIRDNFFHTPGPAIQIEYGVTGKWFESGPVEDVEITDNIFDQCNFGCWGNALFLLGPMHGDPTSENIRIHGNRIHHIYKPLVRISNVDGFVFSDNEIVPGTDYPHWESSPDMLVLGPGVTNEVLSDFTSNREAGDTV